MQYDNMVATLSNAALFGPANEPWWGNYFHGDRGLLLINREGYEIRPRMSASGGRGAANAAPPTPMTQSVKVGFGGGATNSVDPTAAHIRNFLDCVRSRQRPVADIAIGFNSTLPTLLAVESIKAGGKAMTWDAAARRARPV
jgi:hypothetical protein